MEWKRQGFDCGSAVPETESLSLLLTALRTIAEHVDYAYVRPAGAAAPWEYDIEKSMGRPTSPAEYFSLEAVAPPLLAEYAIDAYVAQVLTSAHLAKAQSLKAFDIQPLGNDRFLVVANEPGEWLAPAATSPTERLQLARTEFGGMCSPIHKSDKQPARESTDPHHADMTLRTRARNRAATPA